MGLLIGLIPISARGAGCGTAFIGSDDAMTEDLSDAITADLTGTTLDSVSAHQDACEDIRSILRIPALVLLVPGLILFLVARRPLSCQISSRPR